MPRFDEDALTYLPLLLVFSFTASRVEAQAPGGVSSGLELWLDGSQNVTAFGGVVSQWADRSGTTLTASQAVLPNRPLYRSTGDELFNYNSSIDFVDFSDQLVAPLDLNPSAVNPLTAFVAYRLDVSQAFSVLWGNDNSEFDRFMGANTYSDGSSAVIYSGGEEIQHALISSSIMNDGVPSGSSVFVNGGFIESFTQDSAEGGITSVAIGAVGPFRTDFPYDGQISEVLFYSGALSDLDRQKIESYLAIRYGATLATTDFSGSIVEGDYVASDASVLWAAGDPVYHNDIAVIGRDDASGLQQLQSRAETGTEFLSLGIGGVFSSNSTNPNSFSNDLGFVAIGSNARGGSLTSLNLPASLPSDADSWMHRNWKAVESGSVGSVSYHIPNSIASQFEPGSTIYLLVSNSSDFSSSSTVAFTDDGDGWEALVDLPAGTSYIAIAGTQRKQGNLAFVHGADLEAGAGVGTSVWPANGDGSFASCEISTTGFDRDESGSEMFGTDSVSQTFLADTDGDLVADNVEIADGTDPLDPTDYVDTDGDQVPDYVEGIDGTDPNDALSFVDTDSGGMPDYVEIIYLVNVGFPPNDINDPTDDNFDLDTDGDLVPDQVEIAEGTDPFDPLNYLDSDGDLVPDYVEITDGTDHFDCTDYDDSDGDFVPDYVEEILQLNMLIAWTDPTDPLSFIDTDNGGMPDYVEVYYFPCIGLSANDPNNPFDDPEDTDADGVPNWVEIVDGTDFWIR